MMTRVSFVRFPVATRNLIASMLCISVGGFAQTPSAGMPQRTALRILDQGTWGATAASISELQAAGFNTWYANQVNAPISSIPDQPLLNATTGNTNTNVGPLQVNFFTDALSGKDQLRQRIAFILSQIWVVSNIDLNNATAFPPILRIFQNRAFDNYRNLMQDITLNPAMGHYLDMANNNKGVATKNTAANENYARELMQLFTLGLDELHSDGTAVLDSNGIPVPVFTQSTVTNLAKMLTGWTYAPVTGVADRTNNPINFLLPMEAHETEHDTTAKSIFGVNIPMGTTALQDVDKALDTIFAQSTLPPFVCKQLIQHLVTSNPTTEYVSRVSAVFVNNGNGVRGDMKAVIAQILTDPEARNGDSPDATPNPDFGHFREPVLFLANMLRGLNGQLTASTNVQGYSRSVGRKPVLLPQRVQLLPSELSSQRHDGS